jgi:hypothetical protein
MGAGTIRAIRLADFGDGDEAMKNKIIVKITNLPRHERRGFLDRICKATGFHDPLVLFEHDTKIVDGKMKTKFRHYTVIEGAHK